MLCLLIAWIPPWMNELKGFQEYSLNSSNISRASFGAFPSSFVSISLSIGRLFALLADSEVSSHINLDTAWSVAEKKSHIARTRASYWRRTNAVADVKFPVAINIFALSACSKAMLHMILLEAILSVSKYGLKARKINNLLSSSADLLISAWQKTHNFQKLLPPQTSLMCKVFSPAANFEFYRLPKQ